MDKTWRPLTDNKVYDLEPHVLAVAIGTAVYISEKTVGPQGQDGYHAYLGRREAA